ncbi:MAG: TRAP transporter substrate-binding protein [Ectothiorhodospiraceae bacterium]|nr:TRAP transporter substrate-binding protein [Ectothiorhodospiraceae bacterium]
MNFKSTVFAAAIGTALVAGATQAQTVIKTQTAMAAGQFTLVYLNENWAPKVEQMTGGKVKLEILPSQAVVPHREVINAVSAGILQGDFNAVAYYAGKDPAFGMMGDLIAGYDNVEQFQMFCRFGGGREVLQKIYDKITGGKIHVVGCGPFSKEGLISSKPLRGVDDLKGIKIRSPEGMAAAVFKAVGASPTAIPWPETYTAVEKGIVDAADGSSYTNNSSLGFHKIAKYPLFPGIHSMAVIEFTVNKAVWDKLGPQGQAALETWYYAAWTDMSRASDIEDRKQAALDRSGKGDPGVEVIDWSQTERDKFRAAAAKVWADYAKQSPLAQEAYDKHIEFMKTYGLLN